MIEINLHRVAGDFGFEAKDANDIPLILTAVTKAEAIILVFAQCKCY
jgi:hypothetical protein